MDEIELKRFRDEFVLTPHDNGLGSITPKWRPEDKEEAVAKVHVDPDNFDAIIGKPEKPSKEFKEAAKRFKGKLEDAERFYEIQPIYYDEANIWWLWNNGKKCWYIVDEVTICNNLYQSIGYDTVNGKERAEILQALKQVGRMYRPKVLSPTWIQFKEIIVDVTTGKEIKASPEYFSVNPIPWELHRDKFMNTPVMDRIFEEWVGKEYVKTLYEIIAYCLLPDYPLHRLFCFIGSGMNGKSCYLRLIEKFIGNSNCCSTELDSLLSSRFEVSRLHKKLVCIMGETNFNELSKTSILKKLTGQDLIGFEYKNKNPFQERNYAKILISTNNLPETTDKTDGFYRRWLIIDFPNQFSEARDILGDIPEEEYQSLALKSVSILYDLLKERRFTGEGDIEARKKSYEDKSNPFDKFYKENIEEDANGDIPKWEFERNFNSWCKTNRFREHSDMAIAKKMRDRQIAETRLWKDWFDNNTATKKQFRCWIGIKWKK